MSIGTAWKAFKLVWKNPKLLAKLEAPQVEAKKEAPEPSHLRLLAMLQQSGRLVDFLKEDISSFTDAQVGAAVRQLHDQCASSLEDLVTIRSIYDEAEGAEVQVPEGYDPASLKITGQVQGEAPFKGTLRHKGWRAHKRSLPKRVGEGDQDVICPAEVEIK